MKKIYVGKDNSTFQRLETLKYNRNKRYKSGEFIVEGVKPINQAVKYGWEITSVITSDENSLSDWAQDIIKHSQADTIYILSPELMEKFSDREETSEILLTVKMRSTPLEKLAQYENPLFAVCDRTASPGNLGTIMRTCSSFKVDALFLTGHGADQYDPQVVRASIGTCFSLPVYRFDSNKEIAELLDGSLKNKSIKLIATSARGSKYIDEVDMSGPSMLFFGNETDGLSRAYKEMVGNDNLIKIPIYGEASSLNIGCAVSICLYEADRQRRKAE